MMPYFRYDAQSFTAGEIRWLSDCPAAAALGSLLTLIIAALA